MKIKGERIPLQCFDNTGPVILTIEQIRKILHTINYLWLLYLNWYWWNIKGYRDSVCINDVCTNGPVDFARYIHTRGPLMLTLDQLTDIEHSTMGESAFELRAHRFYKIFGKGFPACCRPFHQVRNSQGEKAYTMYHDRRYLVIGSPLPDSGYTDQDIDWIAFKKLIDKVFLKPDSSNE